MKKPKNTTNRKAIWITIIAVVIFVNLPLWDFFIGRNYTYRNADGSFTYEEETGKGGDFLSAIRVYTIFLYKHPEKDRGDNNLYRTFTIQPWRFWEWREMVFHHERFSLPYLKPSN